MEGTCVYLRLIYADIWQKATKFCKAIIVQLKIDKYFKNHLRISKKTSLPLKL